MSIELTREHLQAAPIRVTDPETRREYVVLTSEQFEQARALFAGADDRQFVQDFAPEVEAVFGRDGWDDPAMDVYNEPPQA